MPEEQVVDAGEVGAEEAVEESQVEEQEEQIEDDSVDDDEAEEDGEESEEEPAEETAEEAEERLFKLNVMGKEIEVDEEELQRLAQKGMGADKKFMEASRQREEMVQFLNEMKDPSKIFPLLEKMGHDTRKITEDFLWEQMQMENMTAEQKELIALKKKDAARESEIARQKKENESRQLQAQTEEWREKLDTEFTQALDEVAIPKTNESAAKMAYYMEAGLAQGTEVTAKEAAELVRQDMYGHYREIGETMTPDDMVKLFGEGIIKKLKNYELSQIKDPSDNNKVVKTEEGVPVKKKRAKKKSWTQLKEEWDAKFGGDPLDE